MAVAVWPATLPQTWLAQGYREQPATELRRVEMTSGAAKQRGVRRRRRVRVQLDWMTATQRETFVRWYDDTLGGALPFSWADPDTGSARTYRFAAEPVIERRGAHYTATLTLEVVA